MNNLSYWKKLAEPDKTISDITDWGIPEQKTGNLALVGGNSSNFSAEVRLAEFLNGLPLRNVELLLPDVLRSKIPPVPGVSFAPCTDSGSFAKSPVLADFLTSSDFTLISGDISKNSATAIAFSDAIKSASPSLAANSSALERLASIDPSRRDTPLLLTRDSVDVLSDSAADFIERENLFLVASLAQLQKLFRSLMYPKMIMLSQPLVPIVETLHKFTLSYSGLTLLTFHGTTKAPGQIIIANAGKIVTIPIDYTSYSPLSLWSGTLAAKIACLNLWNPEKPIDATAAAVFWDGRYQPRFDF